MQQAIGAAREHLRCGRHREALAAVAPVIEANPNDVAAFTCAAEALFALREYNPALQAYRAVTRLNPGDVQARFRVGLCQQRLGQIEASVESLGSVAASIDATAVRSALGRSLLLLGRLKDARPHFEEVLRREPTSAEAFANLGVLCHHSGEMARAIELLERAIALDPKFLEAQRSLGLIDLLVGDFARGWPIYRSRFGEAGSPLPENLRGIKPWEGSALSGQTLLLHEEQGLGDTIQFARYALSLKDLGARVICRCQPALKTLLARSLGGVQIIGNDEAVPDATLRASLLDLPHLLDPQLEKVPAAKGYLASAPASAELERQLAAGMGLRVGLFWWGNQANLLGRHRSCAFEYLEPLLQLPEVTWFSLQHAEGGQPTQQPSWARGLRKLGALVADFDQLAAAVAKLDLVITIDTVTAHLAGALGARVWTLLSFPPDWRWGLSGDTTPWYRSMRLFRMQAHGAWPELIARVAMELAGWSKQRV